MHLLEDVPWHLLWLLARKQDLDEKALAKEYDALVLELKQETGGCASGFLFACPPVLHAGESVWNMTHVFLGSAGGCAFLLCRSDLQH